MRWNSRIHVAVMDGRGRMRPVYLKNTGPGGTLVDNRVRLPVVFPSAPLDGALAVLHLGLQLAGVAVRHDRRWVEEKIESEDGRDVMRDSGIEDGWASKVCRDQDLGLGPCPHWSVPMNGAFDRRWHTGDAHNIPRPGRGLPPTRGWAFVKCGDAHGPLGPMVIAAARVPYPQEGNMRPRNMARGAVNAHDLGSRGAPSAATGVRNE